MKQSNRENDRGAEIVHPVSNWITAYENHVLRGGPPPDCLPHDLPDEDQEKVADARRAIDKLRQVSAKENAPTEQSVAESPPQQLGDFRILHEIGRGGMGVVYEAEQISLPRRVALKILPFAAVLDPRHLERFKNEARAAATLDHPGIVSVYLVGTERGIHYYAMQFIEGQSLAEVIDELKPDSQDEQETRVGFESEKQPASTSSRHSQLTGDSTHKLAFFHLIARLGAQAAAALDHAHTRGIVHRDVKPGNLLLDTEGRVHVADFGLARMGEDAGVTMTGDVLGTLRYMSPEQALARRAVIDHRTDIYSLGATLYELLTLRPLFKGRDRQEMLRKIALEEPQQPSKLNAKIPVDLETIVLKAISKDPTDRYDTAQAMADDLYRFIDGKPVQARRINSRQRLWRWSKRNPVVAALSMSVAALATLVAIVTSIGYARTNVALAQVSVERDTAQAERKGAIEQRNAARQNQYYAEMIAGQPQIDSGNFGGLYSNLLDYLPLPAEEDIRDWEWYYLMSKCRSEELTINYPGYLPYAAWSPDGKFIGTPGAIWQADTGECFRRFSTSYIKRQPVTWSPDGQKFAWAMTSDENAFYIWDRSSDSVSRFAGHKDSVWSLAWGPDGSQIASGGMDNKIRIWDVETETVEWSSPDTGHWTKSLDWSPNGKLLAAGRQKHGIEVWDVATKTLLSTREGTGIQQYVSWRPDGKVLAVSQENSWYLLDTDSWQVVQEIASSKAGPAFSYSPDGSLIAIADGETVIIWNSTGEKKVAEFNGHRSRITSLSWHPNGRRLVSSDQSQEIKLWDLDRREPPLLSTDIEIESVAWLDGVYSLVAVDQADGSSVSINARDGSSTQRKPLGIDASLDITSDRKLVADYNKDEHAILILDAQSGVTRSKLPLVPNHVFASCRLSHEGSRIAIQTVSDQTLYLDVWDVGKEKMSWNWEQNLRKVGYGAHLRLLKWNRQGSQLAAVGFGDPWDDGTTYGRTHLYIFDVDLGKRVVKLLPAITEGGITELAWSSNEHFIAVGTENGQLEVIDAASGERRFSNKIHRDGITALAWHPEDNRLVAATRSGEVLITSSEEGKVLTNFSPFQDDVVTLAWSNDGQRLAAATSQGEIQTWDAGRAYDLASGEKRRGELAWAYYDRSKNASTETYADSLKAFLRHAPDSLGFWQARGDTLARLGEFDRAVEEFSKATGPDLRFSFASAYSRAFAFQGAGQIEEFHQACAELVEAFQDSPIPSNRGYVAWLTSLASNSLVDYDKLVAMAQASVDKNKQDWRLVKGLALGGALYRNSQYEEANLLLTELAKKSTTDGDWKTTYEEACAKYFLSMSRISQGHKFQAQRLLNEANDLADAYLEHRAAGRYWKKVVALQTLRREASVAIEE